MMLRPAGPVAMALLLVACGSGTAPAVGDNAAAQGDIRGGSISDAMLPLDDLKSESPPMKPEPTPGVVGVGGTPGEDNAGDVEGDPGSAGPAEPSASAEPTGAD